MAKTKAKAVPNLLRPSQSERLKDDAAQLQRIIQSPDPRVDRGVAAQQLRRLDRAGGFNLGLTQPRSAQPICSRTSKTECPRATK